jgi:hypothetical protein
MKTVSKKISFRDSLTLESGQVLSGFELMTETYGELNSDKTNAVLVCHAFSGNHHAAGISDGEIKPGWWDEIIGDGKTIDTTKFLSCPSIILEVVMALLDQLLLQPNQANLLVQIFLKCQSVIGLEPKNCLLIILKLIAGKW